MTNWKSAQSLLPNWPVFIGILAFGLLITLTQRVELFVVLAAPIALFTLRNFRATLTVSVWMMLIWMSRLPETLFELDRFSYVVYLCMAISLAAYGVRLLGPGGQAWFRMWRTGWGIWLFLLVIVIGAVHGVFYVEEIPPWMSIQGLDGFVEPWTTWTYFRTFALPGIFQLLLALLIAAGYSDGKYPAQVIAPAALMLWILVFTIGGVVVMSGQSLGDLAQEDQRRFLSEAGFHANTFGGLLAISYAILLGAWQGARQRWLRALLLATIVVTGLGLVLTFSRGAYLAALAVTGLFYIRGSLSKKIIFIALLLVVWFVLPAAVVDRVMTNVESRDINAISADRIEGIWLPLLADIRSHVLIGQGLHSILWTEAQQQKVMLPVGIAHNGYIDLLLDVGMLGAIAVFGSYLYLWRGFMRMSQFDPDSRLRGLFLGGRLAVVALLLVALTNERLTPSVTAFPLWLIGGIMLGRMHWLRKLPKQTLLPTAPGIGIAHASEPGLAHRGGL